MARNRCASHVLQCILIVSFALLKEGNYCCEQEADAPLILTESIQRIIDEMQPEFYLYLTDPYASHIFRAIISAIDDLECAGVSKAKIISSVLCSIDSARLKELVLHNTASPTMQAMLEKMDSGQVEDFLFKLTGDIHKPEATSKAFLIKCAKSEYGSRFLEVLVKFIPKENFIDFYTLFFRGNLIELCRDRNANFLVQKLILFSKNSNQFLLMISELEELFKDILKMEKPGIICRIAEKALEFTDCQSKVWNVIFDVYHTKSTLEKKELLHLILYSKPCEERQSISFDSKMNFNGCQLASTLFKYPNDLMKPLVDGLLDLDGAIIAKWSENDNASRVIEAFFNSQSTEKVKKKITSKIMDFLPKMAMNKYASHIVELLFNQANSGLKGLIAETLLVSKKVLEDSFYGRFVIKNCKLKDLELEKEKFVEKLESKERKRKMFDELLNDKTDETLALLEPAQGEVSDKKSRKKKVRPTLDDIDLLFKGKITVEPSKEEKPLEKKQKSSKKFDDLEQVLETVKEKGKKKSVKKKEKRKFMA